jgi:Flp pilus assembly protein TadD
VEFFRGEMFRQRDGKGDQELAKAAYLKAVATAEPHPEAMRNLGYIYLKESDTAAAREQFQHYLVARPDASDREMIEFYLTDDP